MTNRRQGPPLPHMEGALRAWLDADKSEQRKAFNERVKRLRAEDKPNPAMEWLRTIADRRDNS